MQHESYSEGVANQTGPELCVVHREVVGEALVGYVQAGYPAPESTNWGADVVGRNRRQYPAQREREMDLDPTGSNTPRMHGSTSHANREIPGFPVVQASDGAQRKSEDARC